MRTRALYYYLEGEETVIFDPSYLELSISLMPITISTDIYVEPEHEWVSDGTDWFSKQNKWIIYGLASLIEVPAKQLELHIFPVSFGFPELSFPVTQLELHIFSITLKRPVTSGIYLEMEMSI